MKIFKSADCVEQVRDTPLYETVKEVLGPIVCPHAHRPYRPAEDGFLCIPEEDDVDRVLDDLHLPYRLAEVPFEVVSKLDDCFYALYLANNQFGITFLIPDAEWVTGELRRHLLEHLDN